MLRIIALSLLPSLILLAPAGSALAGDLQLGDDIVVGFDGAGELEFRWYGSPVLRLELLLEGGLAADASTLGEHGLSRRAGAMLESEDPGSSDAPSTGGLVRLGGLSDLAALGLEGLRLRSEISHWPYFHVDDILFWSAGLERLPGAAHAVAAPAVRLSRPDEASSPALLWLNGQIRPHRSLQRERSQRAHVPYVRLEHPSGRRLYVALLRMDGRRAEALPGGSGVIWGGAGEDRSTRTDILSTPQGAGWPLAVIAARTMDGLRYSIGQAHLSYRADSTAPPNTSTNSDMRPVWEVPVMCEHCRAATIERAELQIHPAQGDVLRIDLELTGLSEHAYFDAESVALSGFPLAPWFEKGAESGASYRLPLESPPGRRLRSGGALASSELEMSFVSGLPVTPQIVVFELDPSIQPAGEPEPPELPSSLSPSLIESWPNPFREHTTVLYRVPSTLRQAFEFEDGPPTGLDLESEPPFGSQPSVRVRLYNVSGKLVRVLQEAQLGVGEYQIDWDGTDDQGRPVAAGAYYLNVEMGEYQVTRRVLRLKP